MIHSGRVALLFVMNAATLFVGEVGLQMRRLQLARALGATGGEPVIVNMTLFLVFIGAGWALLVWNGEGPDRRQYHWAMPVGHATHDILRVAAGAAWLMAGSALPLLPYLGASIVTLRANRPILWIGSWSHRSPR